MKNSMPKIAYIIADAPICGGVAVVCQHVNRLALRGFETCIVSVAGEDRIDWFPDQRAPVYPIARMPAGIDIGVATWWGTTHHLYRMNVPRKFYLVQSDETRFYAPGSYERLFARHSYWFDFEYITEARWIQGWLEKQFGHEAHYVPNGVDLEIFHPAEPIVPRGAKPRVLIEGPADTPRKGVAEAFSALHGLECEVWYINSQGTPDPSWKIDRYFHGVPMVQMKHIYSSCDILLKMSTVEGSFGPPLEMMACGGVCVVCEVTGVDEAIMPGENALVVAQGDIKGAREAVERLLRDRSLRQKLIERGKETVRRLDWEKSVDLLADIYRSPRVVDKEKRAAHRDRMMQEEAELTVDAYAELRKRDDAVRERDYIIQDRERSIRENWKIIESARAEIAKLQHLINDKNDELNSIYYSKQWKIATAFKEARHSIKALLKLPFRIIRGIF